MDAIEYFKGMRKRLCEDYLKLLPKKSVGYQTTLREMSFYDAAIKALDQAPCIDAISRSEAIRVASGYCHFTNIPDELAKLPSVNPKPCEDAISRRLLKYLGAECIAKRDENDNLIPLGSVDSLPSVSTEKTGRWIMPVQDDGMSDPIYYQVRCSECGFDLDPQTWHQELHQYGADKYCPNCGANMFEPQESEVQE